MISKRRWSEVWLYAIKIVLIVLMGGMFTVLWYRVYRYDLFIDPFYGKGNVAVVLLFLGLYVAFAKLYGGLNLASRSSGSAAFALAVSAVITDGFMYLIICLLARSIISPLPMLLLLTGMILGGFAWAVAATRLHNALVPPMKTVLIYDHDEARQDGADIIANSPQMFALNREINAAKGGVEAVLENLDSDRPEAVMICGLSSTDRNDVVKYCIRHAVEAYVRPNIGDFIINGAKQMQMCNLPVMLCQRSYPPVWYMVLKRFMDIVLSLAALLVFSPFMLITAAAIKLYDGGPVFYKQVRLTKNRKEFYVYKFRSMKVDAEKDGVARLASQNDDRITPVGKVIRSLRIDEMPQLFCILKGDMTIVGPRPERPEIAEQYEKEIPEFALRLQAKAGLTGYAQVYGKYNTTPYNKLQMDLQYIGSIGVITDLKIILATIKILFVPESTEGVAQGQTTAEKKK